MTPLSPQILQRVKAFISEKGLLPAPSVLPGGRTSSALDAQVFVGFSGGPDSVALLHILHSLGYRCRALHCNFHLRGEESDRDEAFARRFCLDHEIALQVEHFDTLSYMSEHGLSLEMAARRLRYDWWQRLLSDPDAQGLRIALGHHLDDSLETMLMNLMRGTGIQGLTGIVAHNEATRVIRPLLCLTRAEILDYLAENHLGYVTDSSNLEGDTLRNRVRLELLPLMQQLLPQARTGLASTMLHLQATEAFALQHLDSFEHLTTHRSAWGITWDEICLKEVERYFGDYAEDYLHYWTQKHLDCSSQRAERTSSLLYTRPISDAVFQEHRPRLISAISSGEKQPQTSQESLRDKAGKDLCQYFDLSSVAQPVTIRLSRQGDRIAPLGLDGHTKLLSDLFQNAHYSPMQKATTWVVEDARGSIIWVIGLRISHLHRVTSETTEILCLTAE